jgi:hypothetical protein
MVSSLRPIALLLLVSLSLLLGGVTSASPFYHEEPAGTCCPVPHEEESSSSCPPSDCTCLTCLTMEIATTTFQQDVPFTIASWLTVPPMPPRDGHHPAIDHPPRP